MTQLITDRTTASLDTVMQRVGKVVAAVRDTIDEAVRRRGRRDQPRLRVISSRKATPLALASDPHMTVCLSEEQSTRLHDIERDASVAAHENLAVPN